MIAFERAAICLIVCCFLAFNAVAGAEIAAFPGAEGGGALSKGGRGGRVIEVTNLNDSGPGSFRAAVEADGPRTVVFKVSGIINITGKPPVISKPFLTIAGQTAPRGGVTLKGQELRVETHDVVVRFLAIRPGVTSRGYQSGDGIGGQSSCVNDIFDHCSISWTNDENIQIWTGKGPSHHITFSWILNAEGLTYDHPSCGMIIGTDADPSVIHDISIHHNLFMNFNNRMPLVSCLNSEIINNIMYNWDWNATMLNGGIKADIIGNKYKWGPAGKIIEMICSSAQAGKGDWGVPGNPSLYLSGNIGPHQSNPNGNQWVMIGGDANRSRSERTNPMPRGAFPVSIHPVASVEDLLVKDVGSCRRLDENGNWIYDRDSVDTRLVNEYKSGKGIIPKLPESVGGYPKIPSGKGYTDTDHDGMPDAWEKARGLNPSDPSDGSTDKNGDGYTNLEDFLNGNGVTTKPVAGTTQDDSSGSGSRVETPASGDDNTATTASPSNPPTVPPLPVPISPPAESGSVGAGMSKIMALGDSITLGTGRGLPKRGGWRIDFWKQCQNAGLQIDFVGSRSDGPDELGDKHNEGHAGYRIHELDAIVADRLKTYQPDLILLMIGTHDMVDAWAIDSAGRRLEKLIGNILKAAPQSRLVVSSIIPIHSVPGTRAAFKFNAQIPALVKSFADQGKQVVFADTFKSITVDDLDAGGMSPTAIGYSKIAKFLFQQVSPFLIARSNAKPATVSPASAVPTSILPSPAGTTGSDVSSQAASATVVPGENSGNGFKPTTSTSGDQGSNQSGICKIMPLGDSITWGQGVGSPNGGGYRIGFCEMATKAKMAIDFVGSAKNGPSGLADKDNEGHPGFRIDQLDAIIRPKLLAYKPDLILLMAGANDIINDTPALAPGRLEAIIEHITSTLPNAKLLVASVSPINTVSGMADARAFNAKIPGIIEAAVSKGKHVAFVDAFSEMTTGDIDSGGVHPTPQGYSKLAKIWFDAAKKYIGNKADAKTTDDSQVGTAVVPAEASGDSVQSTPSGEATSEGTSHGSRTILVAASNSDGAAKTSAKYVCAGKDDQGMINNAFNALSNGGGKVILSAGTYRCSGRINPGPNSWLEGQGADKTVIEVVNPSNGYIPITINKPNVTVKGLTLAGQGFIIITTSNVSIQNVVATSVIDGKRYKASGNGMFFIWANGTNCENIEFVNCTAVDCNTHGYNMNGETSPNLTRNIKFLNCRAIRCGFGPDAGSKSEWITGFDFHESQNLDGLLVQGCIAEDNWQCGFHLEPDGWNGSYMRNIIFKDCLSKNNGKRHPKGEESYYASGYHGFNNCTMTNCIAKNNANCGFFGIYTSNAVLNNCSDDGSNHGFKFAKNNDGVMLTNCSTRNNKTFGLWISFTNRMIVKNFHQYDVRGARGVQSILGWYKDEEKYQKPVTNSVFEITAHGGSGEIINKAGSGNKYNLTRQ